MADVATGLCSFHPGQVKTDMEPLHDGFVELLCKLREVRAESEMYSTRYLAGCSSSANTLAAVDLPVPSR